MTKDEIAALRAKLKNPDYINKTCADIGSRLTDVWSKTGYEKIKIKEKKSYAETMKRNLAMYEDYQNGVSLDTLSSKYNMSIPNIRGTIFYYERRKVIE